MDTKLNVTENASVTNNTDSALDKLLVKRVLSGEIKAFDLLVLKYQHKIGQAVYSYIKDFSEVQDVVQEVFIKAYNNLINFRGDSAFYSWLYRIAINTALNYRAASKIRPPKQDIDYTEAHHLDETGQLEDLRQPDKIVHQYQILEKLQSLIESLPNELKKVITLREVEGLDYQEIAAKLNCPVGTVRSRLFRARAILQEELKDEI